MIGWHALCSIEDQQGMIVIAFSFNAKTLSICQLMEE
jgi:hypothetical protein